MSSSRFRPRRRLRSELFPLLLLAALPVALAFAFPSGVVDFVPRTPSAAPTFYNAFVALDAQREQTLLAAARSSWQSDPSSRRGARADLLGCGLPSDGARIASGLRPSARKTVEVAAEYEADMLPEGVAAEAPAALKPVGAQEPTPAFSKADLLKLN